MAYWLFKIRTDNKRLSRAMCHSARRRKPMLSFHYSWPPLHQDKERNTISKQRTSLKVACAAFEVILTWILVITGGIWLLDLIMFPLFLQGRSTHHGSHVEVGLGPWTALGASCQVHHGHCGQSFHALLMHPRQRPVRNKHFPVQLRPFSLKT